VSALVVYSSRTGNTRRIAQAIHDVLPEGSVLAPVAEAPNAEGWPLVLLGFWVDRGGPDALMKAYMSTVRNCPLALFGTLGANPESEHARAAATAAEACVSVPEFNNRLLGTFLCQGKIDPGVLAAMEKMRAAGKDLHPMTPERRATIAEAAKHPGEEDFEAAREFAHSVLLRCERLAR
jgi:flavodoxin